MTRLCAHVTCRRGRVCVPKDVVESGGEREGEIGERLAVPGGCGTSCGHAPQPVAEPVELETAVTPAAVDYCR
jgi:hypothetical protein